MRGFIRHKLFGSRRRTVTTSVVAFLLIAGSAFAAWTVITSSGQGNGKFGSLVAPTVEQSSTPAMSDLVPNSAAFTGSLNLKITNPNAGQLYLKSIAGIVPAGGSSGGTCPGGWGDIASFISTIPSAPSLSIPVAGGAVTEVSVPAVIKADDATPSCAQGASIAINLTGVTFSTAP